MIVTPSAAHRAASPCSGAGRPASLSSPRSLPTPPAPDRPRHHPRRREILARVGALAVLLLAVACGGGGGGGEEQLGADGAAPAAPGAASTAPSPPGTPPSAAAPAAGYGELPAHFRGLVRSEMTNLEPAMQRLLAFIARGDTRMAAFTARQIQDTFILKRSLSEEERRRIASELPPTFVELDREFHGTAGRVAQALDAGDFRHASDLYGEMTRLCVSCHGRYATNRFPALAGVPAVEEAEAASSDPASPLGEANPPGDAPGSAEDGEQPEG